MSHLHQPAPTVLITGATGFVGSYLLDALRQSDKYATAQIVTWGYNPRAHSTDPASVDIRNPAEVESAIEALRPDFVVHLAAQSHVPTSFYNPRLTWDINVMGTLNLLEAVKAHAPDAGVLYISSSEVYGSSFKQGECLTESVMLQPQNPYAASKAAADIMAGEYAAHGMRIIRMRPFNHIGPGQGEQFVASAFASQIARIEAGLQPPTLKVGNLEARRDFLDVRDVVRAYVMALEHLATIPCGQVFNICSGSPRPISALLDILLQHSSHSIAFEQDPERLRPSDVPMAAGNSAAIRQHLQWAPTIPLEQTLGELLAAWRLQVGG